MRVLLINSFLFLAFIVSGNEDIPLKHWFSVSTQFNSNYRLLINDFGDENEVINGKNDIERPSFSTSLNLFYNHQLTNKWSWFIGIGYNQTGYQSDSRVALNTIDTLELEMLNFANHLGDGNKKYFCIYPEAGDYRLSYFLEGKKSGPQEGNYRLEYHWLSIPFGFLLDLKHSIGIKFGYHFLIASTMKFRIYQDGVLWNRKRYFIESKYSMISAKKNKFSSLLNNFSIEPSVGIASFHVFNKRVDLYGNALFMVNSVLDSESILITNMKEFQYQLGIGLKTHL